MALSGISFRDISVSYAEMLFMIEAHPTLGFSGASRVAPVD
jgi:hypothetical protein